METKEYSQQELLAKAEQYCARAEHSESEVRAKLSAWSSHCEQNTIIEQLRANNYINDRRYAQAYCHDKLLYQGWGRRKIEMMLHSKHIEKSAIEEAIENIDKNEYFAVLKKVASTRAKMPRETTMRFLMQRGFAYDEVTKVMKD